nr:ADP-ribosylation factor-like protein [Candidatus Sigynarchaeota archaeon]
MAKMTQEKPKKKKILLLGLDNAGKTSIVKLVIKKMTDAISTAPTKSVDRSETEKLKHKTGAISTVPTKGVDRSETEILGQEIVIHDLGGQKKYRQKYIENNTFFEGTDVLIFVTDLQDKDRYDVALDYFDKALSIVGQLKLVPKIYVFLHKFDGDYLEEYKDVKTRVQLEYIQLKDSYERTAKKHSVEVTEIFKTSISDEWGVFAAFNSIWVTVVPKVVSIQAFLDNLVAENQEIGLTLVLDQKGNVLGKKLKEVADANMDQIAGIAAKSVLLLLDWQNTIEHNKVKDQEFAVIEVEDHSIMIRRVESLAETLYLLIYTVSGKYKDLQQRLGRISFTLENIL